MKVDMINQYFFQKVSNAQLIIFRVFFGLLMVVEAWGAIALGWVKETFVDPRFTFHFMGFDWTQFLVGSFAKIDWFGQSVEFGYMYVFFFVMGCLGWFITFGYKYRFAAISFATMWTICYFMQKSHYNNHYYLVVLISWFMALIPANHRFSIDVKKNPNLKSFTMPNWVRLFVILQVGIVYFYAAVAKLYPGWWEGKFLTLRLNYSAYWFKNKLEWNGFAEFLTNQNIFKWPNLAFLQNISLGQFLSWLGLGFDFLLVPLLLWRPTRHLAFLGALVFHLFNSVTLHIGIFPYFALALCVFFYSHKTIEKRFFKRNLSVESKSIQPPRYSQIIVFVFMTYFILQIYMPLRHWHIKDDVLWTEEGHRLSWRMMLRTKSSDANFYLLDKKTNKKERITMINFVTPNQLGDIRSKPDMMWQFAQKLKKIYAEEEGRDIGVFVQSKISINGSEYFEYIDSNVDLTTVDWNYFGHQKWILPSPGELHDKARN